MQLSTKGLFSEPSALQQLPLHWYHLAVTATTDSRAGYSTGCHLELLLSLRGTYTRTLALQHVWWHVLPYGLYQC